MIRTRSTQQQLRRQQHETHRVFRNQNQHQNTMRKYHTSSSLPVSAALPSTSISALPLLRLGSIENDNRITDGRNSTSTNIIKRWHGGPHVDHDHADVVHINFVLPDDEETVMTIDAYVGESLLQVVHRNSSKYGIELEGACEGVCACATCHVIVQDDSVYDTLEEPSEDEEDMLDMAFGLTETSRLGCQVIVDPTMDGTTIEIPRATRNFYVDGHIPQPH